jgi:CRISPR-associated protein (TIGR03984 family)
MTLYARAGNNISFQEALKRCAGILPGHPAIALLYTPSWCGFAQVKVDASLVLPKRNGKGFDRESLFEARVFSEAAELRWLKDWPNEGRAALISEQDISGYLDRPAGTYSSDNCLNQTYLLWGEGIEAANEALPDRWSRLAVARIGTIDVPYPLDQRELVTGKGERIQLLTREYLDVIDDFGNVAVVEERLLKLERA